MGYETGFHAPSGAGDFLGFRKGRHGGTEIVYDDGVSRRMIWRVSDRVNEAHLCEALSSAVSALRVVPALMDETRKRAIALERVGL